MQAEEHACGDRRRARPLLPQPPSAPGEPGKRQKKIRATVSRFPYLDTDRNETIDVEAIPRQTKR